MACLCISGATLWTWQVLNVVMFQTTERGKEEHFMSLMFFRFAHFWKKLQILSTANNVNARICDAGVHD